MSIILRVGAVKPNGGQEPQYGSGDEASSSYTDADVLDIPLPEHTYQRPLPPSSIFPQTTIGYFGLPYQDHNYGMPPPPSPPRPATPRPSSPLEVNGVVQMEEEVKTTPLVSEVEEVMEDSVTRCICGYLHDDGFMICCDKCSVWQHIDCMGVDRNDIPDSYLCEQCQPRILDAAKAKIMQKRKREELAARNVLSDSSATDTDPEEANNALASMGKKPPIAKKKTVRQKRAKVKEKSQLKLKVGKTGIQKTNKTLKKEKENLKSIKIKTKKMFKAGSKKLKTGKAKGRFLTSLDQINGDPWNSHLSPWVDSYEMASENQYSSGVNEFLSNYLLNKSVDSSDLRLKQLSSDITCVADVKKNRKGLKATQEIPSGQVVIEYKGKVMLRHDYDEEHSFVNSFKKLQPFVLFYSKLDVDLCVDARNYGNESRFIRRSCCPNSEVQHTFDSGKVIFIIVTLYDISSQTEITIPFDYNYQECSFCVECACIKNNCEVSRYWKKMKGSSKPGKKESSFKKKNRSPNIAKTPPHDHNVCQSPVGSPIKGNTTPVKALFPVSSPTHAMTSPVKLSNVSTLLAASALLDGDLDVASSLGAFDVSEALQKSSPPPVTQAPLAKPVSSRRASKLLEETKHEEKPDVSMPTSCNSKEKHGKHKESKAKESKDHLYYHNEVVKRERKLSARRQSQEDSDTQDSKAEELTTVTVVNSDTEDATHITDEPCKKMTREERKLDAIMKAFEKMEKRQERRLSTKIEPMAKKGHDSKTKKGEDSEHSNATSQSKITSHDGPVEEDVKDIKTEPESLMDVQMLSPSENELKSPSDVFMKSPGVLSSGEGELKVEEPVNTSPPVGNALPTTFPSAAAIQCESFVSRPVKEEPSPHKVVRKTGKRKRRRSRAMSATVLYDTPSEEGNVDCTFPPVPFSASTSPSVSSIVPQLTPPADEDNSEYKFIKTKKHLFTEWSHKHEEETKQEEMFVQCLPSPHVNNMDHLQRRNSHSFVCSKTSDVNAAGSAKKRWLRQAMHEVPMPEDLSRNLSINTDAGNEIPPTSSPARRSSSPNPIITLGSPRAASPLDFVTPLKKRRLMRESLSDDTSGSVISPSAGILAENFTSNNLSIVSRPNGVKPFFPPHRHSTDDRLLLHKNYPIQNGFLEVGSSQEDRRASASATSTVPSLQSSSQFNHSDETGSGFRNDHPLDSSSASGAFPSVKPDSNSGNSVTTSRVNGITGLRSNLHSFNVPQPSTSTHFPLKLRNLFEKIEVGSSAEGFQEKAHQASSSSLLGENVLENFRDVRSAEKDENNGIGSSASTSTVVVVNSKSVYNGAGNLMEEGSEAGCVTTKSIMDTESPAIVRVDLNAHEMEPTSLSDNKAVVNLNDKLFKLHSVPELRTQKRIDECQINSSSEDVVNILPLPISGHSSDICDNMCTDSSNVQVHLSELGEKSKVASLSLDGEVDSSQYVNRLCKKGRSSSAHPEQGDLDRNISSALDIVNVSAAVRSELSNDGISSSGQITLHSHRVCYSKDEGVSSNIDSGNSANCDSHSLTDSCSEDVKNDSEICHSVSASPCDNVPTVTINSGLDETGEDIVSESHNVKDLSDIYCVDGNVDSTSSESRQGSHNNKGLTEKTVSNSSSAAEDSCCDSNFERLTHTVSCENSRTTDDHFTESQGVSSSNISEIQTSLKTEESISDTAISTAGNDHCYRVSPNTSHSSAQCSAGQKEVSGTSPVSTKAENSPSVSDSQAVTPTRTGHITSNESAATSEYHPQSFSLCQSSSQKNDEVENDLSSTTPGLAAVVSPRSGETDVTATNSIYSSAEAVPATKKKVSLLEYRKRLKEKPVAEPKVSPVSTMSPLSRTSSALPLPINFSASISKSSLHSHSRKTPHPSSSSSKAPKHQMPTLATLPLFKPSDSKADPKKDEKRKVKSTRPEKHLSLTDRLRLEFGLDDCGEDHNKTETRKISGSTLPPPPPPPLPNSTMQSHGVSHPLDPHTSRPSDGTSAPVLINGGSGIKYNYHHQQPSISSTSLIISPQRPSANDRQGPTVNLVTPSSTSAVSQTHHMNNQPPYKPFSQTSHYPSSSSSSLSNPTQYPSSSSSSLSNPTQYPSPSSSSMSKPTHQTPPPHSSHYHLWPNPGPAGPSFQPTSSVHHSVPVANHYDYNHRQVTQGQAVSGNIIPSDHPPPPPSQRLHHRSSMSLSTSSLHRHHQHHSSSGKNKSSKAAASSSSSIPSKYIDSRNKF